MKNKGFTLIELLVVVAIIGILSSVVLTSLNTARMKARDAKRLANIKQIQVALEFYYDANGFYPNMIAYLTPSSNIQWTTGFASALSPYLSEIPTDYATTGYLYSSTNSGSKYGLATGLESSSNSSLMLSDNGYFSAYYEVGQSPRECASVSKDWWGSTAIDCP